MTCRQRIFLIDRPRLFVMCGIPGCGKSTWAKRLSFPVVSSDALRLELTGEVYNHEKNEIVFDSFHSRIKEHILRDGGAVADSTALTSQARSELRLIADLTDAESHLLFFTNTGQALQRNRMRKASVPEEAMSMMLQRHRESYEAIHNERWNSITFIESVA